MQGVNWTALGMDAVVDVRALEDEEIIARMPDTVKVKNHLMRFGKITSIEAFKMYGITRLADVIYKLRKRGEEIKTEMVYGRDRYGDPTQYGVYYLVGGKNKC